MKKKLKLYIPLTLFILIIAFIAYASYTVKGSIPIITYHSINDKQKNSEYSIEAKYFEQMIKELKENDFTFLSLEELADIAYGKKKLPKKPILITFDDGYDDNYSVVYPILKKYNAKASIFIIGAAVDKDRFLKSEEIEEMAKSGLISFGNHSFDSHKLYTEGPNKGRTLMSAKKENETDDEYYKRILDDINKNNEFIEKLTKKTPCAIAYPGAMVNDTIIKACKDSGIKLGFIGANKLPSKIEGIDYYNVRRYHINKNTRIYKMIAYFNLNK